MKRKNLVDFVPLPVQFEFREQSKDLCCRTLSADRSPGVPRGASRARVTAQPLCKALEGRRVTVRTHASTLTHLHSLTVTHTHMQSHTVTQRHSQ
jgi:hypothetical protein